MKKILLSTNIPAPYRLDLFYYLQTHFNQYKIDVMYSAKNGSNRYWDIDESKLLNTHFVKSKVIKIRTKYDTKHIFIPTSIWGDLIKINPDVIIGWEYNPTAFITLLWCKCYGKKYISLTDGTLYSERNINRIQKILRKLISKKCDAAIARSTKAKEKLLTWGMQPEKIFVSLLTVDVEKFHEIQHTPEQGRILYVGSMIERKGLDLLLSALQYVKSDFCLHIVGNGTDEEIKKIKEIALKANIAESIKICGFKQGKELIKEYQKAECFILPTREDCFGLVLLEALCAYVPIISSKYADGAYDIVYEGKNGILVDPYNTKEFGKKIDEILKRKIELEKTNKEILEKFTFSSVSKGYVDAIEYVLKNK